MFLQQTELKHFAKNQTVFNESNQCNIYFILKRARISINPDYFKVTPDSIEIEYLVHHKGERISKILNVPFRGHSQDLKMKSEYPYNDLLLYDNEGNGNHYKLAVFIDESHKMLGIHEPLLDYEVLYIGQAYGKDGKRTAIDRLSSHSTLQNIYSEAMQRNPDSEIWIMLSSFAQNDIMSFNGRIESEASHKDELDRANALFNSDENISKKQKINFTEAALINTFFPPYNKEYKGTFPNPAHDSYSSCFDLDINSLVVELDTSESLKELNSEATDKVNDKMFKRPFNKSGVFHFSNREDRYKMFNLEYM